MDSQPILRKIAIFEELPEEILQKIGSLIRERTYRAGSIIFYEGDPGETMYFIRRGKVKVYKVNEAGGERILHIFKEGDIIGEVVLFNGGDYPACAEVLEEAQIGSIANRDLEKLILENPTVAIHIIKVMAKRLRRAQQQVVSLSHEDTQARIVQAILLLSREHGQKTAKGIEINLPLSNQELANLVGTTRETVNRVLSRLKKDGIIEMGKQKLTVLDMKALQEWI